VENDAADGNLQRTQIPTAACKTLLGFAHFPQARRWQSLTTEHFSTAAIHLRKPGFLSEEWGVPQTSPPLGTEVLLCAFVKRIRTIQKTISINGRTLKNLWSRRGF
jgi:hypothetical protein